MRLQFAIFGTPAEFLTNTQYANICTQVTGYISCSFDLTQGSKWGLLTSDDFDLTNAIFAYQYQLIDDTGAVLQDIQQQQSTLVTLGPEVSYQPTFQDLQADFDAFVAADQLDATYDATQYECITAFQYGTIEGNNAITLQSDCDGYFSVAMIFPGDFANVEFMNNSGVNPCSNQTSYLYCSFGIQNGGKWGLLT